MTPKNEKDNPELHHFATPADYEAFLDINHLSIPDIHLKLAKKASGIPSITAAQAVEVSLCFGWIDGQGHTIDDHWWTIRHLPRRPKSTWSQKNVDTVGRLLEQGRMRPAGVAAVEAAKADGRWQRAYASPVTMKVPDDVTSALANVPAAAAFYDGLSKTDHYALLVKIEMASPTARPNRVKALVEMMAAGERPAPLSKGRSKGTDHASKKAAIGRAKVTKVTKSRPTANKTSSVNAAAGSSNISGVHQTRRSQRLRKLDSG